jgi:hypothetical protein
MSPFLGLLICWLGLLGFGAFIGLSGKDYK